MQFLVHQPQLPSCLLFELQELLVLTSVVGITILSITATRTGQL